MTRRIYLDHNATSPLRPEARAAMIDALDFAGNASSVHAEGRMVRKVVEDAREAVAALVGAAPSEVVFTSGATEANNWVLGAGWSTIVLSDIEHDSVLAPAHRSGADLVKLRVGQDGVVDLSGIADYALRDRASGGTLVSLQLANNETGVLQDVAAAAAFCRAHGITMHTDAVQAPGRMELDFAALGVDALSLSAHKFGGPKGIGALIVRDGLNLPAAVVGGGQERRRRAGTENVAAIAGFGAAARALLRELAQIEKIRALRDAFEAGLRDVTPGVAVIGATAPRLANTLAVGVPGLRAESLVIKLDLAGVAVSAGSACSSGKVGTSHVLAAMGLEKSVADSAIRITLGWTSSEDDLEPFLTAWRRATVIGASAQAAA